MISLFQFILDISEVLLFTQKRRCFSRGFTLLETVVAIAVLMLGVLGPMYLAKQNIIAARDASDRLIASFLAQEGIEMVRSIVANNSADDVAGGWLQNLASGGGPCQAQSCVVDVFAPLNTAFSFCNSGGGPNGCDTKGVLYQDATGVMRQPNPGAGWTAMKFKRVMTISEPEVGKRITASTTVSWPRGSVTLQEDIYNWFIELN